MAKSNSVGVSLTVDSKAIGGLTSINGIEITADNIDVTDLSNTTGYKEKLAGWKDAGEVSLSGFFDGSDDGQAELYTLLGSGDEKECVITFPTKIGKKWTFTASVSALSTSFDVDNAVTFSATLLVSGQPKLEAVSST